MSGYQLTERSRPALQPWCRLKHDRVRGRDVLLAPERVLYPCPTSVMTLKKLDGRRLSDVAAEFAAQHNAPVDVVTRDIKKVLQGLADQGFLRETGAGA